MESKIEKDSINLSEIQDGKCALFKFVNENSLLKVGYQAFIKDIEGENFDEIIKNRKVVSLKWLLCEMGPANKMKLRLKKEIIWENKVVVIIAVGGKISFIFRSFFNT